MRVRLLDSRRHEKLESGYGQLAAGIKQELERRGVVVLPDPREPADVALYVCPPYGIGDEPHDIPVAIFTMHELENLPEGKEDWPERLNRTDLVLTPTSWNRATWMQLGVKTRIEVVPLGIDEETFFPPSGKRCRFLTVHGGLGSGSSRENWHDTMQAYFQAFSSSDRVELVIKTWSWREPQFEAALQAMKKASGADTPPVEVIEDELEGRAMRDLYLSAWIFLKNANREGWGLPATEAVACGTRVAASEIQPLRSHLPPGTRWFTLGDVSELAYLLKDEYRVYRDTMAITHRHTWQATGAWVHRHLRSLVDSA